jgi:hypothetical protein
MAAADPAWYSPRIGPALTNAFVAWRKRRHWFEEFCCAHGFNLTHPHPRAKQLFDCLKAAPFRREDTLWTSSKLFAAKAHGKERGNNGNCEEQQKPSKLDRRRSLTVLKSTGMKKKAPIRIKKGFSGWHDRAQHCEIPAWQTMKLERKTAAGYR